MILVSNEIDFICSTPLFPLYISDLLFETELRFDVTTFTFGV